MQDIANLLLSVKLPVMPEVAHALIRTLSDDDADITTVTRIIEKDPGLTATLLRMANSAIFGLSRSVQSLESAVSVVGMAHIRARALSICLANAFTFPPDLDRLEFWRSSMVCAGYAKWLANSIAVDEQQAWLTGMMLRLGELAIAQSNPEALRHIEAQPCSPMERWKREREATGFDEGQIGAEIARRWDFPEVVSLALQASANPLAGTNSPLGAVVHLAGILSDPAVPPAQQLGGLPIPVIESLGLNVDKLQKSIPSAESLSDISMLQAQPG
jgi:HD-like signal output (HDOD) protein